MSVKSEEPAITGTIEGMGFATQRDITDKADNPRGHAIRNARRGRYGTLACGAPLALAGSGNNRVLHCGAAL
jgi:hypothetical protein